MRLDGNGWVVYRKMKIFSGEGNARFYWGFSIFEITWWGRTFNVLGGETGGKARLAKGYLGTQGAWREKEGMGNGKAALPREQIMEGYFR